MEVKKLAQDGKEWKKNYARRRDNKFNSLVLVRKVERLRIK